MEERTAMKVHRAMTRWGGYGKEVNELMLLGHGLLAIIVGIVAGFHFELAVAWFFAIAAITFIAITGGLYFRPTVWISVVLGSLAMTALATVALGALIGGLLAKLLPAGAAAIAGLGLGAVIGLCLAVASYGPFIRRLRSAPSA